MLLTVMLSILSDDFEGGLQEEQMDMLETILGKVTSGGTHPWTDGLTDRLTNCSFYRLSCYLLQDTTGKV